MDALTQSKEVQVGNNRALGLTPSYTLNRIFLTTKYYYI